jgi:hypothetical protein
MEVKNVTPPQKSEMNVTRPNFFMAFGTLLPSKRRVEKKVEKYTGLRLAE